MPRRGKPKITVTDDGLIRSSGSGRAGKTTMHLRGSEVQGEFLEVTLERNDPDDRMEWHLHFSLDATVMIVHAMLHLLPARAALQLIGLAMERPDVVAALRAIRADDPPAEAP